jgi:transposase InsO family protein
LQAWANDIGPRVERRDSAAPAICKWWDAPAAWHRRQNGHVERVIGSIRRESLDRLVVFDEAQLRRVLKNYASYYNQVRTHLSLDKNAPDFRRPQKLGPIAGISIQYVRL